MKVTNEKLYRELVARFNAAAGSAYNADVHFLAFTHTSRGWLVGYTCGRPNEIRELRNNIAHAEEVSDFYGK